MPELLGRREIGLPSAGAESNELIAKQAWYVKKKKFWGQHFVPELLGRREISLPSAGAESNE